MLVEIVTGVPKAQARSIQDATDAAARDRLAEQVAQIRAAGQVVACDNGHD